MPPRDFDDDFAPASPTSEKSPGVYSRAEGRAPNDLDVLWSGSKFHKEERSPFIFFIAGFILAAILTSTVFIVLNNKPKTDATTQQQDYLQAPIEDPLAAGASSDEANASDSREDARALENTSSTTRTPGENATSLSSPSGRLRSRTIKYSSYVVKGGDTLGSIAIKVYGASTPALVDKIQRANNLSSPDKLQLDQKLVIPPMN